MMERFHLSRCVILLYLVYEIQTVIRFVAIDGTSLTVCEVDSRPEESWFTFMLVEYTQKKIIIPSKKVGGLLNIEVDVLGKYSESALAAIMPRIEELESKVKELEQKLSIYEGNQS
jgi:riboflavin synthase